MADPNGSLLELRHINQIYGGGEQIFTAIQDVTLALNEGEFATLMGPTGCGKSTLLRIITGLQAPTAGEVLYRGKPLHGVNPHSTIVFQTFALFPWLTVQENVEVALKGRAP
jgi:NitT/TauT family transport system ATP-binding protein